ncbi:hypothetical protein C8F01DRAFT_1179794 [Mycena amicta]|nr:hypothetical protein C8F01DRAFT_1179794 [Mycena amicta]
MFLPKAFVAFSALLSLFSGVDSPGVVLSFGCSASSSLSSLLVPGLPFLPATDFPSLPVSSLSDKPEPIGFSPANGTAFRQRPVTVIGHFDLEEITLRPSKTMVVAKDIPWVKVLLVAVDFAQDDYLETIGYIAYHLYNVFRSLQFSLVDLESLLFALDVPFSDIIWVAALLLSLEAVQNVPFLVCGLLPYGRRTLELVHAVIIVGGLVVTVHFLFTHVFRLLTTSFSRSPHFACIIASIVIPSLVSHTLRTARRVDNSLALHVRLVLDSGLPAAVSIRSRYWNAVGRIANRTYRRLCSPVLLPIFIGSLLRALEVPFVDLIWVPALLVALSSTPAILFVAQIVLRYGRKTLKLVEWTLAFAGLVVMWPHLSCVAIGHLISLVVRRVVYTVRKMDRHLDNTILTVVVAPSSAICAASFAVLNLQRRVSRLNHLFVDGTCTLLSPELIAALSSTIRARSLAVLDLISHLTGIRVFIDETYTVLSLDLIVAGHLTGPIIASVLRILDQVVRKVRNRLISHVRQAWGKSTEVRLSASRFFYIFSAIISMSRTARAVASRVAAKMPFAQTLLAKTPPTHEPEPQAQPEPTPAPQPIIQRSKHTRETKRYRRGKKLHIELDIANIDHEFEGTSATCGPRAATSFALVCRQRSNSGSPASGVDVPSTEEWALGHKATF